ncbi:MAG: riboflavin synthase [Bacteroidota bacterium]
MFTGIVEEAGTIVALEKERSNLLISIKSSFINELKVDQSISHDGICLTVVDIKEDHYSVTAIKETLDRTNLGYKKVGDKINLERCVKINDRLDGHIVQGHIDQTAICKSVEELNGSWMFYFNYDTSNKNITVEKGSISVNGVSLTVVDSEPGMFSVAIIPYTFEATNFCEIKAGTVINIEFDIIGKYIAKLLQEHQVI